MIYQVFSVYDNQVQAFLQPFFCRTKGEAIRSFTEACNDPQKPFGKYALDYSLVHFGEWDDNSGLFVGDKPTRVVGANEVIEQEIMLGANPASAANGALKPAL